MKHRKTFGSTPVPGDYSLVAGTVKSNGEILGKGVGSGEEKYNVLHNFCKGKIIIWYKTVLNMERSGKMFLLHWAIFIFIVGLLLSLPLGAIYYLNIPLIRRFYTNPRKLKAAHLDFFMQAFSIGLVYLLALGMNTSIPIYVVIPLAFGTFFNPFIFLLEATPLYKASIMKAFYQFLKAVSPTALFFAWFMLLFQYLPAYYAWLLVGFVIISIIAFLVYVKDTTSTAGKKDFSSDRSV